MTDGILRKEIENIRQDPSELRKFGLQMGLITAFLGLFLFWKKMDGVYIVLITTVFFTAAAITTPRSLGPVYKGWMTLGAVLGFIMTRLILTIVFYLMVTPLGLAAKICKKTFLDLTWDKNKKSYWLPREDIPRLKTDYEKLF